jgi:DnaJ family protein B protein 11
VQVGTSGVTRPGEVRWFQGEGMPQYEHTSRGDLWVTYSVAFPRSISEAHKAELRRLFGGDGEWQRSALAHDEL